MKFPTLLFFGFLALQIAAMVAPPPFPPGAVADNPPAEEHRGTGR